MAQDCLHSDLITTIAGHGIPSCVTHFCILPWRCHGVLRVHRVIQRVFNMVYITRHLVHRVINRLHLVIYLYVVYIDLKELKILINNFSDTVTFYCVWTPRTSSTLCESTVFVLYIVSNHVCMCQKKYFCQFQLLALRFTRCTPCVTRCTPFIR